MDKQKRSLKGVYSLTDVPVFAMGPWQKISDDLYGNIDIFFNMENGLGRARASDPFRGAGSSGNLTSLMLMISSIPFKGVALMNNMQREYGLA